MDFKYSNVPLASDCRLLSYRDNRLRLCKSRNASRRMHSISLALSSSSCSEFNPLNTPLGRSLILLPYNTLCVRKKANGKRMCQEHFIWQRLLRGSECWTTYSDVSDLSPEKASCATLVMLLLDKSMRRSRRWLANAFGVSSVIRFCSRRLWRREGKEGIDDVVSLMNKLTNVVQLTVRWCRQGSRWERLSATVLGSQRYHLHTDRDADKWIGRHTLSESSPLILEILWVGKVVCRLVDERGS